MNRLRQSYLEDLHKLYRRTEQAAEQFNVQYADQVQTYRHAISEGLGVVLDDLRQNVEHISDGNKVATTLVTQAAEYVDWAQWTFWDLPYFAIALHSPLERFRRAVAACGMVYLSMRIVDDVIDRHFWYKGKRPTLLSVQSEAPTGSQTTEPLTVLAALLVCFQGLSCLTEPQAELETTLRETVRALRSTVIGAIMELSPREEWTPQYYERLTRLKNVEYWRSLYAALDTEQNSELYRLLERYYALAQMLNDVQDYPDDERRNQPNLISVYLRHKHGGHIPPNLAHSGRCVIPPNVEDLLATQLLELGQTAERLPEPDRQIAQLKLHEYLQEAYRLGLFVAPDEEPVASAEAERVPLRLQWHSDIDEVIERAGLDALQEIDCAVCESPERRLLFTKQGYAFHRCLECSHIYVSPRIRADLQKRIAEELDDGGLEDSYLEIQKIYAAFLCDYIHPRAPGPRILDIGFGRGYLMQLTRAYGFEVYGIDSSTAQIERLKPQFGDRVCQVSVGLEKIPWGAFDVVVMSHVLEHLVDPAAALSEVRAAMNPGGLLYIAVPDMESVQFRMFGKHLETINPLVHLQYFTENSLSRLLQRGEFSELERVSPPSIPEEIAPRWMRLVGSLGGCDSGELAMVAHVPDHT